jgi:hypothetical protein
VTNQLKSIYFSIRTNKQKLEWMLDALCTQCDFGIKQVEHINMVWGSNEKDEQETCMMSNCEQSVEQEETRESDAIFLPYFKEKLEGYLYLQKFC